MPRVEWTPEAVKDIDSIFDYIAEKDHRPSVAAKLLREIHAKCYRYAEQPLMGIARPDLGTAYRCFGHKRYVVIYLPIDDGIEVHAVVDGARDYGSLFGQ